MKRPGAETVLQTVTDGSGNQHGVLTRFEAKDSNDPAYELGDSDFSILFAGFLEPLQSNIDTGEVVLIRKNLNAEASNLPAAER